MMLLSVHPFERAPNRRPMRLVYPNMHGQYENSKLQNWVYLVVAMAELYDY